MIVLYSFPLSAFCRKVRFLLAEKKVDFELINENYWERRADFLKISPAATVPVYLENSASFLISEHAAICEYIDEVFPAPNFIGGSSKERAEIRAQAQWFDVKFYNEVTRYLLDEKIIKYYRAGGQPSSEVIRAAKYNINAHIDYINYRLKKYSWLAGENFSLADISAATQLSVVDYMNDVPWAKSDLVKEWYSVVKSRSGFKQILGDRVIGFKPPAHYANLDF